MTDEELLQLLENAARDGVTKLNLSSKRLTMLPKEEPDTGNWANSLAFEYHYGVLPGSVISRFIVRMNHLIHRHTYWRSGVMLAYDDGGDQTSKVLKTFEVSTTINQHCPGQSRPGGQEDFYPGHRTGGGAAALPGYHPSRICGHPPYYPWPHR